MRLISKISDLRVQIPSPLPIRINTMLTEMIAVELDLEATECSYGELGGVGCRDTIKIFVSSEDLNRLNSIYNADDVLIVADWRRLSPTNDGA